MLASASPLRQTLLSLSAVGQVSVLIVGISLGSKVASTQLHFGIKSKNCKLQLCARSIIKQQILLYIVVALKRAVLFQKPSN